jgi:hypothetical protein
VGKPGEDGDKGGQVGMRSTKKTLTDFFCSGYLYDLVGSLV